MLGRSGLNETSTGRVTTRTFSRRSTSSLLSFTASRRRGSYWSSQAWVALTSTLATFGELDFCSPPKGHHQELAAAAFSGLAGASAFCWPSMLQPDAVMQRIKVDILNSFMGRAP
ncbi:hypothetical protein D9M71_840400 [compost metagenome]